jgi:hypothetical protein
LEEVGLENPNQHIWTSFSKKRLGKEVIIWQNIDPTKKSNKFIWYLN